MRILHVITSLRTGGAEHLLVDLLPLFREKGIEVELLVFDGVRTPFYEELEKKRVLIHALRVGGNVYDPRNISSLREYVNSFDIIHTHNTAPQFYVPLAVKFFCSRKNKPRLITTEHSTSNRRRNLKLFKLIDRWMYNQYHKIICVSDISGKNIVDYTGDVLLPFITIPNGINYKLFNEARSNDLILEKYGQFHRGIMVAGFRYEKDQPTVIRAYSILPSNYHLFLVGDGDRRNEYAQLVKELGCTDKVHFLGIRLDVPTLLRSSDIIMMSSHREGLSLSNLEGMASGRPFIASDVDGLHEIVDGYGILVPHEDPQALADAIRRVSEDREYAKQVAYRCVERAKMFDISVMAEKYSQLYLKCCSGWKTDHKKVIVG